MNRSFIRSAVVGAVGVLCLTAQPATAYAPSYDKGDYEVVAESIRIYGISTKIDPGQQCAEIYGKVTVSRGNKTITLFEAEPRNYKEACEDSVPLNEGSPNALLRGTTEKKLVQAFSGDKAKDEPFVFSVNLWELDGPHHAEPLVNQQKVKVWPERHGVMTTPVYFERDNEALVSVNYKLRPDTTRACAEAKKKLGGGQGYTCDQAIGIVAMMGAPMF
ncbi:hypothetical protein ACFRK5_21435 [Streptomyces niveus]|uniref:hypothetical protein n=1 Tax=Streptomyces niveus TaxID=193462 RepID=UPI00367D9A08